MEKSTFVELADVCGHCRFSHDGEHSLECRRYPPNAQPLLAIELGRPKHIGTLSVYPPIKADAKACGEFSPHIETPPSTAR